MHPIAEILYGQRSLVNTEARRQARDDERKKRPVRPDEAIVLRPKYEIVKRGK